MSKAYTYTPGQIKLFTHCSTAIDAWYVGYRPLPDTPAKAFHCKISGADGKSIFDQDGVMAPSSWSDTAVTIVANKYFRTNPDTGVRESSVYDLCHRVCKFVAASGRALDYFSTNDEAIEFYSRLMEMTLSQRFFWNSPVWFNLGARGRNPQASACFINGLEDSLESILQLAVTEGTLFKGGSGAGTNLSVLRGKREKLGTGGYASGPVSFMRGYDSFAGVIKSGGATRRAARMQILNIDHPDIEEFIDCKLVEEGKAKALIDAGYSAGLNGDAYSTVAFQNANHSVRVTSAFMAKAVQDTSTEEVSTDWALRNVTDGTVAKTVNARDLLTKIAVAAHSSGDPGLQFDDAIQSMHTCPEDDKINASNPCCFVGETLVHTSMGKIAIQELVSMDQKELPKALSWDMKTNAPVLAQITRAWCSGAAHNLVKVTTDKGLVFRCTPNHVFFLHDGTEVEAGMLQEGMRLKKTNIYLSEPPAKDKPSRLMIYVPSFGERRPAYRTLARWMYEQEKGPLSDAWQVVVSNGVHSDVRINNLRTVRRGSTRQAEVRRETDEQKLENIVDIVDSWECIERTPIYSREYVHTDDSKPGRGRPAIHEVTPARWNAFVDTMKLGDRLPKHYGSMEDGLVGDLSWEQFAALVESNRGEVNDRVVSVEVIRSLKAVPVYDIEVEGQHNFTISGANHLHGIVVHNSEYMFLDDTACNLASLNVVKYLTQEVTPSGIHVGFDTPMYVRDVKDIAKSMDIIVDAAWYPTDRIGYMSRIYRTLGVGITNLGSALMLMGLPYGRGLSLDFAGALMSLTSAATYAQSCDIGAELGVVSRDGRGIKGGIKKVLAAHSRSAQDLVHSIAGNPSGQSDTAHVIYDMAQHSTRLWSYVLEHKSLPRNAQATVIAPTGTIAFAMDCATTGCEPELALLKYKTLSGGGLLTLVNPIVRKVLAHYKMSEEFIQEIHEHITQFGTVQNHPSLPKHIKAILRCSLASKLVDADDVLTVDDHLNMMAALQPFTSGAISKTVNLPKGSTVKDVLGTYKRAWSLNLKAVALYVDESKGAQPLRTAGERDDARAGAGTTRDVAALEEEIVKLRTSIKVLAQHREDMRGTRKRLPSQRPSMTSKFELSGLEGYITTSYYTDGTIGEIFVNVAKEGSTVSGLLDSLATAISIAIQHGTPVETIADKLRGTKFEPSGWYDSVMYTSLSDYLGKYLSKHKRLSNVTLTETASEQDNVTATHGTGVRRDFGDHVTCPSCHNIAVRSGTCYTCTACGETTGCG